MYDKIYNVQSLSRETFRLETFSSLSTSFSSLNDAEIKNQLVKAGFFYTQTDFIVKCFVCYYELDVRQINPTTDVLNIHKVKNPKCDFIKSLGNKLNNITKKFLNYDGLRYEKQRLETFIEWPLYWLSPSDLAADGFYYLRTKDHCACCFCGGIIGDWERGDIPRVEHYKFRPFCSFIQDEAVGNIPIAHSNILEKLPLDGEEYPMLVSDFSYQLVDKRVNNLNKNGRLYEYNGPIHVDYITIEARERSFKKWPERIVQKPKELAEAGFFYCGK